MVGSAFAVDVEEESAAEVAQFGVAVVVVVVAVVVVVVVGVDVVDGVVSDAAV